MGEAMRDGYDDDSDGNDDCEEENEDTAGSGAGGTDKWFARAMEHVDGDGKQSAHHQPQQQLLLLPLIPRPTLRSKHSTLTAHFETRKPVQMHSKHNYQNKILESAGLFS